MRTLRLFSLTAFLVPLVAAAQVDTESGNNICEPLFPVDIIAIGVPNNAAMNATNDVDFFRVELPAGVSGVLEAVVTPLAGGGPQFSVRIYDSGCNSITDPSIGQPGGTATAAAVVCGGSFNVRVALQSGPAVAYTIVASIASSDEWMECNNTFATATPIPADTVFPARLYGMNTVLTNGQGAGLEHPMDQDFFKVTPSGPGVLTVSATQVPNAIQIVITVYDSNEQPIGSATAWPNGADVSFSALLCDAPFYYVRIRGMQNYENSPLPFQLSFSFDTTDVCECNNTFLTACEVPVNTTFMTKLHGTNTMVTDDTGPGFDMDLDQDFFKVVPQGAGTLTISATQVPSDVQIVITVYDSSEQPIGSNTAWPNGADVSFSALLCDAPFYYVQIRGMQNYENSPLTFQLSFSFDTTDECECNNTFTTACEQEVGGSFPFKIYGTNSTNYYTPNDRDFFKFTPERCGTMNFNVVNIPPGFTIRARLYSDTTNINDFVGFEEGAAGPNPLSMIRPVAAGQTYYLMVRGNNDDATHSQLMTGTIHVDTLAVDLSVTNADGPDDGSATVTVTGGTPPYTYAWSNGATGATAADLEQGVHSVVVTDANGCSITTEVHVINVSVAEYETTSFGLRPNPTNGTVVLDLAGGVHGRYITVLDATGRMVLELPIANISGPVAVDLSGQENGLYLVQVRFADGTQAVQRVVKE